ncbi:MBL fold metallo-hydrolase [Paracoccaceae bacterium]|nr:MBL fold metallo-hydrolase [Paracoccaceae bacterium]
MVDFVSLLGVKGGPAIRPGSNMPSSTLIHINGKNLLVDTGLGVSRAICDQGVELQEIDAIFITHMHSDHYLELGPLIHTAWVSGRVKPIPIYGPKRLKHYWRAFLESMVDDIALRIEDEGRIDLEKLPTFYSFEDRQSLSLSNINIRVMRNLHPPIRDSFALRFEWGHYSIVLSGDTAYMPEMIDFADQADLLIHEVMLSEGIDLIMTRLGHEDPKLRNHLLQSHTLAENAGLIAKCAKVKCLALNHFVPDGFAEFNDEDWLQSVRRHWSGKIILGRDGIRIPL